MHNYNSKYKHKHNYPIFPQISTAMKTTTAKTRDFARMEHAFVNQAGKAIWIAQVT